MLNPITLKRGMLVSCEGIDGSGKSTLVKNVAKKLTEHNLPVIATREPGATQLGTVIRTLLQEKQIPICQKAEYLLFASDRAQHFHEIVIPNLQNNKIVISDRMADSSIVYQGFGRNLSIDMIKTINNWSMEKITPDLTLYVKISPEIARERLVKRNEKLTDYEKEKESFFKKLITGFETIFSHRQNVLYLDGTQTPEQLADTATEQILTWCKTNNVLKTT